MDKKYDNLRSKTIFDFTRDEKILGKVLENSFLEDYKNNPDEFISEYVETWNKSSKMFDLVLYSSWAQNRILYDLLKKELFDEYSELFDFEF